jgi:hypothetical protein
MQISFAQVDTTHPQAYCNSPQQYNSREYKQNSLYFRIYKFPSFLFSNNNLNKATLYTKFTGISNMFKAWNNNTTYKNR